MNSDYRRWQQECQAEREVSLEDKLLEAQGEAEETRNELADVKTQVLITLRTLSVAVNWISDIEVRENARVRIKEQMKGLSEGGVQ